MKKKSSAKAKPALQSVGPTPERQAMAGPYLHVVQHGRIALTTVRDAPIDRLHFDWERARRRGSPRDGVDMRRYGAADKFRLHWHHAGLQERFASVDLDGAFARSESSYGMPAGEFMAHHRQQYRLAVGDLGQKLAAHVQAVVCQDVEPIDVGRQLGYRDDKQARVAGMMGLIIGLDRLADFWGIY